MLLSQGNEAFCWRSVSPLFLSPLGPKWLAGEGGLGAAYSCKRERPVLGVGWAGFTRFAGFGAARRAVQPAVSIMDPIGVEQLCDLPTLSAAGATLLDRWASHSAVRAKNAAITR